MSQNENMSQSSECIPTEETGLITGSGSTEGTSNGVAAENDELQRPWPATFERSISLLAGPSMDPSFVDKVTRSPKITPHQAIRARKMKGLNRGYETPDPPQQPHQFQPGIAKIRSLDWVSKKKLSISEKTQQEQSRRALEAAAYRKKLLERATSDKKNFSKKNQPSSTNDVEGGLLHSPGYHKEVETDSYREKTKHMDTGEKASFEQCVFNMSNILMGVGLLGLPYVFSSAGWIGGFFVTLTFSTVAWRTSILLGRELNGDPRPNWMFDDSPYKSPTIPGSSPSARLLSPLKSFPDIARVAFGTNGNIVLSSVLYFELFSCLCIFLVTLGDHLHTLFPNVSVTIHMSYVAVILLIPTALLRTPRLLSYLSAVGTVATICVVLAVFASALADGNISEEVAETKKLNSIEPPYHRMWRTSGLPIAFGLIAYSFSGHAIVPSIYCSMERPQDFEKMINVTFFIVTLSCLVVAVSGYYMFGSTVDDQITISLEEAAGSGDSAITMLTWLMILTAFSKFTLTAFPLALGLEEIFAPFIPSDKVMETVSSLIKLILVALALVVAIFVPSFSFLCSLVGLICTMIVSAIFPAAAHLKLFGPHLSTWEIIADWFFIILGSFMAVVGTIATVG